MVVPYESVVKELQADLIDYNASIGFKGMRFVASLYPEALCVSIKVSDYIVNIPQPCMCVCVCDLSI